MSKSTCSVDGCTEPANCRGLCRTDYGRARKAGTLAGHPKASGTVWHRMSAVDPVALVGDCSVCGSVKAVTKSDRRRSGLLYVCANQRRITRGRGARRKPVAAQKRTPAVVRAARLRKYSLTDERFDQLIQSQNGRCAICRRSENKLQIDHDHACCPGKFSCGRCVRGLLCGRCNRGIAYFHEEAGVFANAATYLAASSQSS